MNRKFTLTDLIITIVILGILAVIVLLNINNLNEKAKITSLNADKRAIQLAVDKYNLDKGICPSIIQPKLGNPQPIDFNKLYNDYIKSMPKNKDAYYWVDTNCLVYVSLIDAPTDVSVDVPSGKITWTPHKDSSKSIIHIKNPNGSTKIVDEDKTGNYDGEDGKDHLVSEEDKHGLETPPVGEDYNGYPKPSDKDNPEGDIPDKNNPEGPIVPCDTDGYICIYTAEELASIGTVEEYPLTVNYRLANNIDLASYDNWEPIIDNEYYMPFQGVLDGNGFSIDNLTTYDDEGNYVGLFYYTESGAILNLTLNNVNIEGSSYAGGIAGLSAGTIFENVSVNGKILGDESTGGIVGVGTYLHIRNAEFSGEINGSEEIAGGIIGYASNIKGSNLKTYGVIEGTHEVGGIFGGISESELGNLYSQANVVSNGVKIGGISGASWDSKYANVHFKGNLTGNIIVGGLIGESFMDTIHLSSVEGNVNAVESTNEYSEEIGHISYGGLIGLSNSSYLVKSSYKGNIRVEIEGSKYTGGIIGTMLDSSFSEISIESDIYSSSGNVGGAVGLIKDSTLKYIKYNGSINTKGKYVGGLAGHSEGANILDSFVEGQLSNNNEYTGGLIGYSSNSKYNKLISKLSVNGIEDSHVNALFGYASWTDNTEERFNNVYWSSELSKQLYSSVYHDSLSNSDIRANTSNHVTGKHLSIEEMKNRDNYREWNFDSVWEYKNNIPNLRTEIETVDIEEFISNLWFKNCNKIYEGKGTEDSPYKIKTQEDFNNIMHCSNSYFKLENDLIIDGDKYSSIKNSKNEDFTGTIDGNNRTITANNLKQSLFGRTSELTIKNIRFKDITIGNELNHLISSEDSNYLTLDGIIFENVHVVNGDSTVGIITGSCYDCSISNITVKDSSVKTTISKMNGNIPTTTGGLVTIAINGNYKNIDLINFSVEGGYMTGGLVGSVNYSRHGFASTSFENITLTNVKVKSNNAYIGGLIGYGSRYILKEVRGNVEVIGISEVGGIVGESYNGVISDVQMNNLEANIVVRATGAYVGGISGYMKDSSLSNVSITGDITGERFETKGIYASQNNTTTNNVFFKGKVNGYNATQ